MPRRICAGTSRLSGAIHGNDRNSQTSVSLYMYHTKPPQKALLRICVYVPMVASMRSSLYPQPQGIQNTFYILLCKRTHSTHLWLQACGPHCTHSPRAFRPRPRQSRRKTCPPHTAWHKAVATTVCGSTQILISTQHAPVPTDTPMNPDILKSQHIYHKRLL